MAVRIKVDALELMGQRVAAKQNSVAACRQNLAGDSGQNTFERAFCLCFAAECQAADIVKPSKQGVFPLFLHLFVLVN